MPSKGVAIHRNVWGPKQKPKIRKCLKCGREFKSTGNRLCPACHAINAKCYADAYGAGDVFLEDIHE